MSIEVDGVVEDEPVWHKMWEEKPPANRPLAVRGLEGQFGNLAPGQYYRTWHGSYWNDNLPWPEWAEPEGSLNPTPTRPCYYCSEPTRQVLNGKAICAKCKAKGRTGREPAIGIAVTADIFKAIEVLNRESYYGGGWTTFKGHAVQPGSEKDLDAFTAIAVAEKYERMKCLNKDSQAGS